MDVGHSAGAHVGHDTGSGLKRYVENRTSTLTAELTAGQTFRPGWPYMHALLTCMLAPKPEPVLAIANQANPFAAARSRHSRGSSLTKTQRRDTQLKRKFVFRDLSIMAALTMPVTARATPVMQVRSNRTSAFRSGTVARHSFIIFATLQQPQSATCRCHYEGAHSLI